MNNIFAASFFDELTKLAAFAPKGMPRRAKAVKRLAQGIKSTRTSAVPTAKQSKSKGFALGQKFEGRGSVYKPGSAAVGWQKFSRPISKGWQQGGFSGAAKGAWAGAKAAPMFGVGAGVAGLVAANALRGNKQSPGSVQGMVNIPG